MLIGGIQTSEFCKIRLDVRDKKIVSSENNQALHQAQLTDPDRPRPFLSTGPVQ